MIVKIFSIISLIILSHMLLQILHHNSFPLYIGIIVGACMMGVLMLEDDEANKM